MKNRLLLLSIIALISIPVFSQPPVVYFNFITHNEDTPQWNNTMFYTNNRAKLINLSNYFQLNGMTWNMQSDYVYLNNVLSQETTTLMSLTNNKNILRWMYEDKGVEMDPHSHESLYLYPDVVKLMDSIGLPESKVIGGSIYNDSNGRNIWTNLIYGQNGVIFPNRFWQPEYLMGGGTPNHVADIKGFGFWNPTDTSNYLTHNPSSPLHHISVGCEIKIKDTSNVTYILAQLHDVINNVQNGNYPPNGIYLQTVFFEQGDLNNMSFYNKVIQVADSMNAIVATGMAQWKTLKQTYTIWQTTYSAQMFQWECGQLATSIFEENKKESFSIYPNPANDQVNLNWTGQEGIMELKIYDLFGNVVYETQMNNSSVAIDVKSFADGMYFIEMQNGTQIFREKFLKQ